MKDANNRPVDSPYTHTDETDKAHAHGCTRAQADFQAGKLAIGIPLLDASHSACAQAFREGYRDMAIELTK